MQIVYENLKPYGVRDETGFLFFFVEVQKFPGQEERYLKELQEQRAFADYLLESLQKRGLTLAAPDLTDKVQIESGRTLGDDIENELLDSDHPCPVCGGTVGHRINCPRGIAFSSPSSR